MSCKNFGKQYIGNTTDHFRSRWNNLKSDIRKTEGGNMENVNKSFGKVTFKVHQGFLKDVEVRLIDKTQASELTKRKFYWMRTLRTLYLDGRNVESDYLGTTECDFKQPFYNHRIG